ILEDGEERVLEVDTVVICAGQVSVDELAEEVTAARRGRTPRVRVVGGADGAAELDAGRASRPRGDGVAGLRARAPRTRAPAGGRCGRGAVSPCSLDTSAG